MPSVITGFVPIPWCYQRRDEDMSIVLGNIPLPKPFQIVTKPNDIFVVYLYRAATPDIQKNLYSTDFSISKPQLLTWWKCIYAKSGRTDLAQNTLAPIVTKQAIYLSGKFFHHNFRCNLFKQKNCCIAKCGWVPEEHELWYKFKKK